jgi:SAM-dependent methyltransferase
VPASDLLTRPRQVVDRRVLRKPYVDFALCLLLKRRRMALPEVDPAALWPGFETTPVTVGVLPKGDWAAPVNDTITLMKLAAVARPARILELGSYRGHTAKALLENAPDAHLTAVDIDPQHGEAYRGTPLEARVDRRVGPIGPDTLPATEKASFDLVFVDADHSRAAAEHDTQVALDMVAPDGTVLWHDYSNWGWFTGDCGVPEVLNALAERLPVAHLTGSNIAVHRPAWGDDRTELDAALDATQEQARKGHWQSSTARRYSF